MYETNSVRGLFAIHLHCVNNNAVSNQEVGLLADCPVGLIGCEGSQNDFGVLSVLFDRHDVADDLGYGAHNMVHVAVGKGGSTKGEKSDR